MLKTILARIRQGRRTISWPDHAPAPAMPPRFRGRPELADDVQPEIAETAAKSCPVEAISVHADDRTLKLDMGRCVFCGKCAAAAPSAIGFSSEFSLAAVRRGDLRVSYGRPAELAAALDDKARRLFGRSLKIRQVSAGGCNACEADCNVLGTIVFDLGRFGIQFVASPRHADALLVTGPVTENMRLALLKTYEATPSPKLVLAVGACAISGGVFRDNPQVHNGVDGLLPVDLYIPGCPPHPMTILDGLLRLLGRID